MPKPTQEQQLIIDDGSRELPAGESLLIKVNSVAGSGKTSTLINLFKTIKPPNALYLAFNASVVSEAKQKFPPGIVCKTLHALAYQFVIGQNRVDIKDFTPRHIHDKTLDAEEKAYIVARMNEFFNSTELSLDFFKPDGALGTMAINYINEMIAGKRNPSFGFLIKWFHLQLSAGAYDMPHYDFLCLDESGDTTGVSVSIFNLIKARRKFMFGDLDQNIYGFMHTVNGFNLVEGKGKMYHMTQSFRVAPAIAQKVQDFLHTYLESDRAFQGMQSKGEVTSMAYISRTNSAMINRMMRLIKENYPFQVLRKPASIFAMPLALINASKPPNPKFKDDLAYIKSDFKTYDTSPQLQHQFKTFHLYLADIHSHDVQLKSAINLLRKHSYTEVFDTYRKAKEYYDSPKQYSIVLTTAFVAKGGEWDSVYIEDDINDIVEDIKEKVHQGDLLTDNELTELRLAYVSFTRCKYELHNAKCLG